jgi:two-component system cell cycle sensor histidine kinase/response regulator CckA
VQRIVKDCSGYLHVQSRVGQGTTFGLYFPVHEGERCQLSGKPPPVLRGSERVLVVDDDVVQLRTARRVLAQLGYSVTTVDSGESALELCGGNNVVARFDLVIVDMVMRGDLNGVATVERLRQTTPDQKALIVSGFAPEQMESLAHDRGLRWLAKPYTTAQLASAVRAALDGGAPEMSTESIPPPPNVEMIAPPPHRLGHTS